MVDDDGLHWTREDLGGALGELRTGIDEALAQARGRIEEQSRRSLEEPSSVTPDAGGALLALLGKLPGVIGNSMLGNPERLAVASETLADLYGRLRDAGVELDERFTGFADRLAGLREKDPPPA